MILDIFYKKWKPNEELLRHHYKCKLDSYKLLLFTRSTNKPKLPRRNCKWNTFPLSGYKQMWVTTTIVNKKDVNWNKLDWTEPIKVEDVKYENTTDN